MATENVTYTVGLKDLFTSKIKSATVATNQLNDAVNKTQTTLEKKPSGNGFGSGLKGALGFLGIGLGINELKNFIISSVQTTAKMQGLTNAIKAGSSTALEGEKNIKFLRKTINQLGLDTETTFNGFKTWQGAIKGTNLDGAKGRVIFKQFSAATTAMGLSGQEAEGVFLAMGQMMSKGTIQAEELRGQLGDRLPGVMQRLANAMKVPVSVLDKMMKDGKLVAEEVLPKLAKAMSDEMGGASVTAANSLQASINRLDTAWTNLKTTVGQSDFWKETLKYLTAVSERLTTIASGDAFTMKGKVQRGLVMEGVSLSESNRVLESGFKIDNNLSEAQNKGSINTILEAIRPMEKVVQDAGADTKSLKEAQKKLFDFQRQLGDDFRQGLLNPNKKIFNQNEFLTLTKLLEGQMSEVENLLNPNKKSTTAGTTDSTGIKTPLNDIEGRRATNINVTIGNLINTQEIHAQNLTESATKIADEVKKALLTMLNDVNYMAK